MSGSVPNVFVGIWIIRLDGFRRAFWGRSGIPVVGKF
jgi:hypothetical protein